MMNSFNETLSQMNDPPNMDEILEMAGHLKDLCYGKDRTALQGKNRKAVDGAFLYISGLMNHVAMNQYSLANIIDVSRMTISVNVNRICRLLDMDLSKYKKSDDWYMTRYNRTKRKWIP